MFNSSTNNDDNDYKYLPFFFGLVVRTNMFSYSNGGNGNGENGNGENGNGENGNGENGNTENSNGNDEHLAGMVASLYVIPLPYFTC